MVRALILFLFLAVAPLFGASSQLLTQLPNSAVAAAVQLDATGNIYVAGAFTPASAVDNSDAFVAKLSPDGSKLFYFTALTGRAFDGASALALAADGSAYIAGYTNSSDFPVTPGAYQTVYQAGGTNEGFLTKVNPSGAIVYSTFVTGPSATQITGLALNSAGEVYVTGMGGPLYQLSNNQAQQGFIMKFDSTMTKVLLSLYGSGGGLIQLDSQSNMYIAGTALPNFTNDKTGTVLTLPPLSATAFQPTHDARFCLTFGSGPSPGGSYPCRYQYVSKLGPTGVVLWATYVDGTYGATVHGMSVDSAGNVIVAGTTNSDDYPVTADAFQTQYAAAAPPFPVIPGSSYRDPPPATGYVTKVNATGTGLLWSTYFGGSSIDNVTGMAVAPNGDIVISGRSTSSDLPTLTGTPDGCRPAPGQELGFVSRIAPDGATAGPTQPIAGAPSCSYLTCQINSDYTSFSATWPVAMRADGTALTAGTNGTVAAVNFAADNRIACLTDPADNVQLRTVAPGQLLSIFGPNLAPATPFIPAGGIAPSSSDFGVFFNGVAAPILYSDGQQINVQVPFEIAGQSSVQMQVLDKQVPLTLAETRTLAVVDRQPAIFLTPAAENSPFSWYTVCGGTVAIGKAALALNSDGSVNDCANPAAAGSVVTLFANGLGQVTPALSTGVISAAPAATLTPNVDALDPNLGPIATTTRTVPGALTALAQMQFRIPLGAKGPYAITPQVGGKNLHERLALIWVK